MTQKWIYTQSDDEARKRAGAFWLQAQKDLHAGEFWADEIKKYRDDPVRRLELAMANLPLPGAFEQAAVAVRALIRARRKASEPIEEDLSLLYWLAAVRSFMLEYAPRLKEPGFNIIEAIPGERLRSLSYDYAHLGYRELSLLNKTDIKWLIEAWGEPSSHATLNDLHEDLWNEYETKLIHRRKEDGEKFKSELASLVLKEDASPQGRAASSKSGCALMVAALAFGAMGIAWWMGG